MSVDLLMLMLPAFAACLVLTGIHVYLGLHVLARGVIFVDRALAQVAALGATFALLWGAEPGSASAWFTSLAFAALGAVLFTLARSQSSRVPVEAFIGIVYAVASAMAVIIADRLPHGVDQIREILVGNLLAVTWPHIAVTAALYALVGVVHYAGRKPFFLVSLDPDRARAEGYSVSAWDLAFYFTFAVVITSSVQMGGVLIVFSYLVIPTVIAALFAKSTARRLCAGWAIGFAGSVLGIGASIELDLPTGAAIVATFGALLVGALAVRALIREDAVAEPSSEAKVA